MKNQKGVSNLILIIVIVAVALVAVGGVLVYQYFLVKTNGSQVSNVPWQVYTESVLPQDKLISEDTKGGLIDTAGLEIGLCGGCKSSPAYVCKDTNQSAQRIKISKEPIEPTTGGYERYAIVCAKNFWIQNLVENYTSIYGPFEK